MELADLERLRDQSEWLRTLARRLVGPAMADDLTQDTVVNAIESPPAFDRPLRPWLVRVLRNTARMRFRSDERRAQREQAVAIAGDSPAPDTALQLLETYRALCELVIALREPLRRTVVAHYFEGLTLAELARRDGVVEATVRWRHARALALIREGLDHRAGGDRSAWGLALTPTAKFSMSTTIARVGGSIMNKVAIGAVVALLSGAGGLWWWRSSADKVPASSITQWPVADSKPHTRAVAEHATSAGSVPTHVVRLANAGEERRRVVERIAASSARRAALAAAVPVSQTTVVAPATARQPGVASAMDDPEHVLAQMMDALKEVRGYVSECAARAPSTVHKFKAELTLTGDPDVGTLIDASELSSLDDKRLPAQFDDCVRTLMQTLELPPIAIGKAFKVTYEFGLDDEPK